MLVKAISLLLNHSVNLIIVLDSKDLYQTISTCRMATDRSIRGDVALVRYEFETRKASCMLWVPGKVNLSDFLTTRDRPPVNALQLDMFSDKLPFYFETLLARWSDQSTW